MAQQSVPTSVLQEAVKGAGFFPNNATSALRPSLGSVQTSPPDATRLVGVDHQLSSIVFSAAAGSFTQVSWPGIGFPGLLSSTTRFYNSGPAPSLTSASIVPNNPPSLIAGQSTQLGLFCALQSYTSTTTVMLGAVSFQVFASSTQVPRSSLIGPWFTSGIKYTGFSCIPTAFIYSPSAVSSINISIGVSAELFAVFIQ
jgi:hypothetical protein